jgi:hypothetical protein
MSKFASVGASHGLAVSSGLRSGAITSSGNISYHSSGEAVDLAGPAKGMMATFRELRSRFGSRLAELIYTPGGVGIKDGHPYTYSGQVAADHFDHVHVAYDTGKPGVGDGMGRSATSATAGVGDGLGGNVKAVWKFLVGKGLTAMQAAGVIGGMMGESGKSLSTTATNKKSGAFGIAQWLGGRKKSLMAMKNPKSLGTQLAHLWSELQGSESGALSAVKGSKSIAAVVKAWVTKFERPGAGEQTLGPRTSNAKQVYGALKGVKGAKGGKGKGAPEQKVSNYEMISAMADVALAQAASTKNPADDILANTQLRDATTYRIKQVRAALKKPGLKAATRLRLTQELGGLVGKHTELQGTLKELRNPAGGGDIVERYGQAIDARIATAQTTETLSDDIAPLQEKATLLGKVFTETQKRFGAGSMEAVTAFANLAQATNDVAKTQRDAIVQGFTTRLTAGQAALTVAQVMTPTSTVDDLAALTGSLGVATEGFNNAVARGDNEAIIEFGGQVLSLRDAIEALNNTVEESMMAQRDAEKTLKEEAQKRANVSESNYATLARAIADVASGQIGGTTGLGLMTPSFPGGGVRY